MSVGDRIKKLRKQKKLTQTELGELLGVQKAAIQKYENGSIVNFKKQTIEEMSKIFQVSPAYIMGWNRFDAQYDLAEIKKQVVFSELLNKYYTQSDIRVFEILYYLNDEAKQKVVSYVEDLNDVLKYVDEEKWLKLKKLKASSRLENDLEP